MNKTKAKQTKKSLKQQFEEYKAETKQYLNKIFVQEHKQIADIAVAKEIKSTNGLVSEQPAGIMVVELLTMAKMAEAEGNRVYIEPGIYGKSLRVYMVPKTPVAPLSLFV